MMFRSILWNGGRFLLLLAFASVCARADVGAEFAAANQLYEQGRFSEAASAYEKLIERGTDTTGLHYNLANARYKAGQPGAALAHWRLAESANPRQPDLALNLQFARANVPALRRSALEPWEGWVRHLTLNEWTALSLISVWLWTAILVVIRLRPVFAAGLRGYTLVAAMVTLLSLLGLGSSAWSRFVRPLAVVISKDAPVRYGPVEESKVTFTSTEGTEARLRESRNGWHRISLPDGRNQGWIRSGTCIVVR
ncbi:MAG: hypothetical protein EXS36_14630 [Pedosphaera sp.]|nr:hypothetical protein [Pedosphaera sp.]